MSTLNTSVHAEQIIREHLISGEIPPGTSVRESVIARKLGMSRTPIREAMSRLAKDGLLQWEQNRGYQAKPLSPEELAAAYPVLITLEELAIENIREPLQEMVAGLRAEALRLDIDFTSVIPIEKADRLWHQRLVAASQNPVLIEMHERILGQISRYIAAYWRLRKNIGASQAEHDRITDAFEDNDIPLATALLRTHRLSGLSRIRRIMADQQAPATTPRK